MDSLLINRWNCSYSSRYYNIHIFQTKLRIVLSPKQNPNQIPKCTTNQTESSLTRLKNLILNTPKPNRITNEQNPNQNWAPHFNQCVTKLRRQNTLHFGERSDSVVECLTRGRGAAGSSLTGCPWAWHINPSLVLVQPRKARPFITVRLLVGRKESNQTNVCKAVTEKTC